MLVRTGGTNAATTVTERVTTPESADNLAGIAADDLILALTRRLAAAETAGLGLETVTPGAHLQEVVGSETAVASAIVGIEGLPAASLAQAKEEGIGTGMIALLAGRTDAVSSLLLIKS